MYSRIFEPPFQKSYFLFGPRGTGKTSWLKSHYKSHVYIDLLEAEVYRSLLAQPERLGEWIPKEKRRLPIILDEVQKIPALLDEVHRLIEKEKFSFVLSGSNARKLKRGGANLLAGRAYTFELFPLTAYELGKDFSLEKSLRWGHLPLAVTSENPKRFLNAYINTYLKEEIQLEGLTRNLPNFARFLQVASFSQGAPLVVANVAQEASIERKVVEDYFAILRDLLLAFEVPVFAKRKKRELISKKKFFFFDVGVFQVLRPKGPLDLPQEIAGPALETLILQEVRAMNAYLETDYEMSYWHTRNHLEVDLILYGPKGFLALEIKASARVRPSDLEGLREFSRDFPEAQRGFVYLGSERRMFEGIAIIPAGDFLKNLQKVLVTGSLDVS